MLGDPQYLLPFGSIWVHLTSHSGWTSTNTTASTTSPRHVAPPSLSMNSAASVRTKTGTSSRHQLPSHTVPFVARMLCETTFPVCTLLALVEYCPRITFSPPMAPSKPITWSPIPYLALETMSSAIIHHVRVARFVQQDDGH